MGASYLDTQQIHHVLCQHWLCIVSNLCSLAMRTSTGRKVLGMRQIYRQGVVTSIGAVHTAKTGDTICVHRNLAVTP